MPTPRPAFVASTPLRLNSAAIPSSTRPRLRRVALSRRHPRHPHCSSAHAASPAHDGRRESGDAAPLAASDAAQAAAAAPSPPRRSAVLRFLQLLLREWRTFLPAVIGAVVCSTAAALQPVMLGRIVSVVARGYTNPGPELQPVMLARVWQILFVQLFEVAGSLTFVQMASRAGEAVMRRLRRRVFATTLGNDIAFFDKTGRLTVEQSLTSDLRILRSLLWANVSRDRGIRAFLEAFIGFAICIKLTGMVSLVIFGCVVPVLTVLVVRLGRRNGALLAEDEQREVGMQNFVGERIRGLRTIKAFGAEEREVGSMTSLLDTSRRAIRVMGAARATADVAGRMSIFLTSLALYVICGSLVIAGKLEFEVFSALIGFVYVLNYAMQGASYALSDFARAKVVLRSLFGVLDKAEAAQAEREALRAGKLTVQSGTALSGAVRFDNVSFAYPSRPDELILKGVSFAILPGQMVALVGESGSGKSTIAAILAKFYAATGGSVTMDGHDIQDISADMYSRMLSVVDQEPFLFTGSIRDNIAYGAADDGEGVVEDTRIELAAREANAHGFISDMADGYDTKWSPGSNVSGGQRQRLAIARSLLKRPQVLVLDEATSALDQESERAVQAALERMMQGRTTLVIAHRLSTVRQADTILYVRKGEIIERGTYDEMYARPGGAFRALVDSADGLVADVSS